jgi:hypothetical protein
MNSNARHDGRAPEMLSGDLDSAACSTPAAPHATHRNGLTPAERRLIERERLRKKRLDPVYVATERAANAARMREHRERLRRCRARRRHAIAEERAP